MPTNFDFSNTPNGSVIERSRTGTHEYTLKVWDNAFGANFQSLNAKTGEPWQAVYRISDGADVAPENYGGRLLAYSTVDKARHAIAAKKAQMAKRKG